MNWMRQPAVRQAIRRCLIFAVVFALCDLTFQSLLSIADVHNRTNINLVTVAGAVIAFAASKTLAPTRIVAKEESAAS